MKLRHSGVILVLAAMACSGPTSIPLPPDADTEISLDIEVVDDADSDNDTDETVDIPEVDELPDGEIVDDSEVEETVDSGDIEEVKEVEVVDDEDCDSPVIASNPPNKFQIQMGKLEANKLFLTVDPEEMIEIVQGPQGGVHVEVAFRAWLPVQFSDQSKAKVEVEGNTYMGCCGGESVAYFHLGKYLIYPDPDDDKAFRSGVIPVIFEQNQAVHYEEQLCCVVLDVGLRLPGESEPSIWSQAHHTFYCVDLF
ncbi:MAG TPA: hypothetical protein EYN06_06440 [Myxococcales bacterium]|nr:hypothetical protein [Myxococcales bacterium]HIN86102.1 hypothetical protein [Myxococcales bacterium]